MSVASGKVQGNNPLSRKIFPGSTTKEVMFRGDFSDVTVSIFWIGCTVESGSKCQILEL